MLCVGDDNLSCYDFSNKFDNHFSRFQAIKDKQVRHHRYNDDSLPRDKHKGLLKTS